MITKQVERRLEKYGVWDLTPIENEDIFYKRDDLYEPFGSNSVNGGKVRQVISLVSQDLTTIRKHKNNTVITQTQVKSPSGVVIGRVAQEFGIKSILCVGGVDMKNVNNHQQLKLTRETGAKIRNVAGHGIPAVVKARVSEIADKYNYYNIGFHKHIDTSFWALFDTTANQVRNLPNDLDILIVPVASGIHMAGILLGIKKYKKRVERIVGIEVGPSRRMKILNYVDVSPKRLDLKSFEMPYSKELSETTPHNLQLDTLYEAKAYNYMKHHLRVKNKKVCLWIVGKH